MDHGPVEQKTKLSILWLDDRPMQITPHVMFLQEFGFQVMVATSTGEALHHVEHHEFDVIISDLYMPPPDGASFLRQASRIQPNAVYIIISGYLYIDIYRDLLEELRESEICVRAVKKPIAVNVLVNVLLNALVNVIPRIQKERKTLWCHFVEALEIKPGAFGVSINLKKLLGITKKK